MDTDMPSDDESFAEIEAMLQKMKPAPLSDDLLNRLTSAMNTATEVRPDNIITMDEIRRSTQVITSDVPKKKRNNTFTSSVKRWTYAAAVAIMGAATALYVTTDNNSTPTLAKENNAPKPLYDVTVGDTAVSGYAPSVAASYDGAQPTATAPLQEKTLWLNNDSPHKRIIVNYTKIYQGKDKDGNPIEISVPATRCILVPDEAH